MEGTDLGVVMGNLGLAGVVRGAGSSAVDGDGWEKEVGVPC